MTFRLLAVLGSAFLVFSVSATLASANGDVERSWVAAESFSFDALNWGKADDSIDADALAAKMRVAEEDHKRAISGPAAEAERRDSIDTFAGLGRSATTALISDVFADALDVLTLLPSDPLLSSESAPRFIRDSDTSVRVDPPGSEDSQLVVSSLPLRNDDGQIVSGRLEAKQGGFGPKTPLANVVLPGDADGSVVLSDVDVEFSFAGAAGSPGQMVDVGAAPGKEMVLYPNTQTDTDTAVTYTLQGIETFNFLRSAESPEHLSLDYQLPDGAGLQATADGGAIVLDSEGVPLVTVFPPFAVDAQGSDVPMTLSIEGSSVGLNVPHRGKDFAYPIMVDPVQHVRNWWTNGSSADFQGWTFHQSGTSNYANSLTCPPALATVDPCGGTGAGVYVSAVPGKQYPANSKGYWRWTVPGGPSSSIVSAILDSWRYRKGNSNAGWAFYNLHHTNGTSTGQNITAGGGGSNLYMYGGNSGWKYLHSGLMTNTANTIPSGASNYRYNRIAAYTANLTDGEAPTLILGVAPSGWLGPNTPFNVQATAQDPGLGLYTIQANVNNNWSSKWFGWCLGTYPLSCTTSTVNQSMAFNANDFPSGIRAVPVKASDIVTGSGHETVESFEIKVDRSNPEVVVGGSATDQANHGPELTITATDGSASSRRSGIKKIIVKVDGATVYNELLTCVETVGTCPQKVERTIQIPLANLVGEDREFEVLVEDQVGNPGQKPGGGPPEWDLDTEEEAVTYAVASSLNPGNKCKADGTPKANVRPQTFPKKGIWVGTPCDDYLAAGGKWKIVHGGAGDDVIYGGSGDQTIKGGPGNDVLVGQRNNDKLEGGPGNDRVYGGTGDDKIWGDIKGSSSGSGNDLLFGGPGMDHIAGQGGDDVLRGGQGMDSLTGGPGTDTVSYADAMAPGFTADVGLAGFPGPSSAERGVRINLADDEPRVSVGSGGDGGGKDYLCWTTKKKGSRTCVSTDQFERIVGSPFSDRIIGTSGSQHIIGGAGADWITGDGADYIYGGGDGDYIQAAPGAHVDGGSGTNNCTGGGTIAPGTCHGSSAQVTSRCESASCIAGDNVPDPIAVGLLEPDLSRGSIRPIADVYLKGGNVKDKVKVTYNRNGAGYADDRVRFEIVGKANESTARFNKQQVLAGGCIFDSRTLARCAPNATLGAVLVSGGGGHDELQTPGFPTWATVTLAGGNGSDILTGGTAEETIIDGQSQASAQEKLSGGEGDDVLIASGGSDSLSGGGGNDLLMNATVCDGNKKIDGGPGRDNAQWAQLNTDGGDGVYVDMGYVGDGNGRWGRFKAGQNISSPTCPGTVNPGVLHNVEALETSSNRDVLIGDDLRNSLLGRGAPDKYFGEGGKDTISANDKTPDVVFNCGSGYEEVGQVRTDVRKIDPKAHESCDEGQLPLIWTQYEGRMGSRSSLSEEEPVDVPADEGVEGYDDIPDIILNDWEDDTPLPTSLYRLDEAPDDPDETAGMVAENSFGDEDESGEYLGTSGDEPVLQEEGAGLDQDIDDSVQLDGVDDRIDIGTELDPAVNPSEGFAIELWVKFDESPQGKEILFDRALALSQQVLNGTQLYRDASGKIVFETTVGTTKSKISSENAVTDDEWHHVVAHLKGDRLTIYLDGFENTILYDRSVAPLPMPAEPNILGADEDGSNAAAIHLDEVAIYDGSFEPELAIRHALETVVGDDGLIQIEREPLIDTDADDIPDAVDNCPAVPNPDQGDANVDGVGDVCEGVRDSDGDGIDDDVDNCPDAYNPEQEISPGSSIGVECEVVDPEDDIFDDEEE